jgi:4-aminobutyrate aminotransferase-like enzyme
MPGRHVEPEAVAAIVESRCWEKGGFVVPPGNYFQVLQTFAQARNLIIADEVQSGIGRTGRLGRLNCGLRPIFSCLKSWQGPSSAAWWAAEIACAPEWRPRGTLAIPLSCAAALGALETLKENLVSAKVHGARKRARKNVSVDWRCSGIGSHGWNRAGERPD